MEDDGGEERKEIVPSHSAECDFSAVVGRKRVQRFFSRSQSYRYLGLSPPGYVVVMLELGLLHHRMYAQGENIRFSALYQSQSSEVRASNGLCGKSLTAALLVDPSSSSAPASASSEHLVIHLALLTGSFELLRWTTDD